MGEPKRKRAPGAGRPAKPPRERMVVKPVRFPPPMIDLIDAECARQIDSPDFSAMVRALCAEGLQRRQDANKSKARK